MVGLTSLLASTLTTWMMAGFLLGWLGFLLAIVALGLRLLRSRSPAVAVAGLVTSVAAIITGAVIVKQGPPLPEPPPNVELVDLTSDKGLRVGEGGKRELPETGGDSAPPATTASERIRVIEQGLVADGVATPAIDPMLKRFGVATVMRPDDSGSVTHLRDNGLLVREELLPIDGTDQPDVACVVEVGFPKARANDEQLRKLGPSLSRLPNLRILNLYQGVVTELGLTGLRDAPVLGEVTLQVGDDGVSSQLTRFGELRSVLFARRGQLTDEGLEALSRLTHLEQLDLGTTEQMSEAITDNGLKSLSSLSSLRVLSASGTQVTSDGIKWIGMLPRLERLDLSQTRIDDRALETLSGAKRLKWLKLRSTAMVGTGLTHLAGCEKLEKLVLSDLPQLDPEQLEHLVGLPALHELVLSGTRLNDAAVVHLSRMKQLTDLDLNDCHLSAQSIRSLRDALPGCVIEAVPLVRN